MRLAAPLPLLVLALAGLAAAPLLAAPARAQVPGLPVQTPATGTTDVKIAIDVIDPGGALVPGRPYAFKVTVHYTYGPGGVVPPGQDSCATLSLGGVPAWAVANITKQVCFAISPSYATSGTTVDNTTAILDLNLTAEAPALEPFNLTVKADAEANGPLKPAQGEAGHVFQPSYVVEVQVLPPAEVAARGGVDTHVVVTLRNLANGPVEVRFTNATAPQGVAVTLPAPVLVRTPGDDASVTVLVRAPWTGPVRGLVTFALQGWHPERHDLVGDPLHVSFALDGKAAVPEPGPAPLAAALLAGALLARRGARR